jgi:hypothetical protein
VVAGIPKDQIYLFMKGGGDCRRQRHRGINDKRHRRSERYADEGAEKG